MEIPPSLNEFLDGRDQTPAIFHEWEVVLLAYQHFVRRQEAE